MMEHGLKPANSSIPRLTLDTNLILEYWKQQDKASTTERLLSLAASGVVELAVTARIHEDIPLLPLANRLNELEALKVSETASITRLDFWVLGRDVFGDENFTNFSAEADAMLRAKGARVPDWRDWDHVHAHYVLKRDSFLTWDKPILSLGDELRKRFGIAIMTPEAYLASRD